MFPLTRESHFGTGFLSHSPICELEVAAQKVLSSKRPKRSFSFPSWHPFMVVAWETFYMFAYCGLVGSPRLAAKI